MVSSFSTNLSLAKINQYTFLSITVYLTWICVRCSQIIIATQIHKNSTCAWNIAGSVHFSDEKLQADDSVDDDDKQHQQSDVKEGDHGFDDGVQHHL